MFRIFFLIINILIVLFLDFFSGEKVTTTMNVPGQVQAGKDFTVSVTVNKGNIKGFSRFQQKIPAGLKARSDNSANADFIFENNRVRLMWLMLPKEEEFTLSYSVQVDERLKGEFEVGGSFAYIENNKRKSVSIEPRAITITPSPDIDPDLIVDIKDFQEKTIPDLTPKLSSVNCIRQNPSASSRSDEIYVNVLVHKKGMCKFAKIEERVPPGYTAVNVENRSGIFTYKNNTVKYLWMNLPPDEKVVVTYKLIPKPEVNPDDLQLSGTFSYIEDNRTKSINIVQRDVDVKSLSKEEISRIYADAEADISQSLITQEQKTEDNQESEQEKIQDEKIQDEKPVEKQPDVQQDEVSTEDQQKQVKDKTKVSQISEILDSDKNKKPYILDPESGVYYRVQLAAGHRPVNIDRYFKKYKIKRDVKREKHEGWFKYSIGSFYIYKDARDHRNHIWKTTSIDDAFVAAYNSGIRITVQEALMITNQKWYK